MKELNKLQYLNDGLLRVRRILNSSTTPEQIKSSERYFLLFKRKIEELESKNNLWDENYWVTKELRMLSVEIFMKKNKKTQT